MTSKKNEEIISSFYKNMISEMQDQIVQKDAKIQTLKRENEDLERHGKELVDSLKVLK